MLSLGVISNLSLLVYAKYTAFTVENMNVMLAHLGMKTFMVPKIALPLGVSFIVFESVPLEEVAFEDLAFKDDVTVTVSVSNVFEDEVASVNLVVKKGIGPERLGGEPHGINILAHRFFADDAGFERF